MSTAGNYNPNFQIWNFQKWIAELVLLNIGQLSFEMKTENYEN